MDELEAQFDASLVRNAACVLAGMKPAALFNFAPKHDGRRLGEDELRGTSWRLALGATRRLGPRGVRTEVLLVSGGRALMLVSRPSGVESLLADPEVRAFLTEAGYTCDCAPRVISCLRRRLRLYERGHAKRRAAEGAYGGGPACAPADDARCDPCDDCDARATCHVRNPWRRELGYPHEVGVLLGYPLGDVRSFIERQGRGGTAVGPWKTYGDVDAAQARWESMRACERETVARYRHGARLEDLVA